MLEALRIDKGYIKEGKKWLWHQRGTEQQYRQQQLSDGHALLKSCMVPVCMALSNQCGPLDKSFFAADEQSGEQGLLAAQ